MGIGRFVYTPILPFMADSVPLGTGEAGLIASANFAGYLAGALAASIPALSGNPRVWFLAALLASAVTTAAMGASGSFGAFLALRFAGGLASAFVLVFASTLVLDRLRQAGRPDLFALHFAGVGAGIALSALMISAMARSEAEWQTLWFVSGAATLGFCGLAAILTAGGPSGPTPSGAVSSAPSRPLRTRFDAALVRLIIAYGLFGFGYVITATFVSAMARTNPSLQSAEPYVWLIVGLSAAPSIWVWNRVATRAGRKAALVAACLAEAAGVALTAIGSTPAVFSFGAGLVGGTFMGITALGLVEARARVETRGGNTRQILALMTASFGLGQMAGPTAAGIMHSVAGSFAAPSLAAAAALLIAAILFSR